NVVYPALGVGRRAVDLDGTVEVTSLTDEAGRVVEARPLPALGVHVPLADIAGGIASGAQQRRVGHVIDREWRVIVGHTIEMAVPAGQETGSARGAERVDDEGVAETNALGRQPVHMGRLKPREACPVALLALDDTHGIPTLIIGVDEEDVGPLDRRLL